MSSPLRICTTKIRKADGTEQVFCGIQLQNEGSTSFFTTTPNNVQHDQQNTNREENIAANACHPNVPAAATSSNPNEVEHQEGSDSDDDAHTPAALLSSNVQGSYDKLGYPIHKCHYCDATLWVEEKLYSKKSAPLTSSICCQGGKVSLPRLVAAPEPLYSLLRDQGQAGTDFRKKIRIYNSLFCFTSFAAHIDDKINESRGPYTFRISGQNYHRVGTLLPTSGAKPRYAQLYFFDTENEISNRMGCMNLRDNDVDETLVRSLVEMLDVNSAVAKAFRMARDWCTNHATHSVTLRLIGERQPQQRQYNMPSVSEVAALVVGDFGQSGATRDIIIQNKSGGLKRISELHPQYMALQYPLLFPYGEDGFHLQIPYNQNFGKRKTIRGFVTMREFYCYRIQQRLTESTILLEASRLFLQFLVDAFTAVEEQRLAWIRFHQEELRADLYNNIADAVAKGDNDAKSVGKRIVLPATYTGSPRYMLKNYQDAMSLCRSFGNPALFITFTANPKWPEVAEMLASIPGQSAHDRPDIMARLFKLKLSQLMKDLKQRKIFGKAKAVVYTIEFQKRGLPHAHILLWLKRTSKIPTSAEIDDIISAEIPCKEKNPDAHKLVVEHMLHGPCGKNNKHAPCMIDNKCSKHFPKPFYQSTTVDEEGFPVYRRRNNGVSVMKGKTNLDNRFVVPYNMYLLLKYRAHINIEWCNQSRAIKYLFKYISKGPDKATAMLFHTENSSRRESTSQPFFIDEIKIYLDCRYLSACEAFWRLLGFDIHSCYPAVMCLPLHLPAENPVTLRDSQSLTAVLNRAGVTESMFTAWLILNQVDPRAKTLKYAEIPGSYVWNAGEKHWQRRKKRKTFGRIAYAHPASGERHYLRMLLNVVKGPTSFEEIRTVNGVVHATYKEACFALGMLTDDKEWAEALQEAKFWATGVQLRELFVTMLLFCDITSPKLLWEQNWEILSEDILYKKRKEFGFPTMVLSEHQLKNYSLLHIQDVLARNGRSLADFTGMPMPDSSLLTSLENRLLREEMSYNIAALIDEHKSLHRCLNLQQLAIYDKVVSSVQNQTGDFFFVYGAGGTGKTYLYKTIMARLRSEKKIVLAVASSGIASLLLPGGRTAHSRFVIPLELLENSTCNISQNSNLARLIHEVSLIIWDEAPMTQRHAFEALNRTLQDIQGIKNDANRSKIFGGITMLLGGDFRQILPVISKGKRQDIVQSSISNSVLWERCQVLRLTQSMRVNAVQGNGAIDTAKEAFNRWVLQIGNGDAAAIALTEDEEETWVEIPHEYIVPPLTHPIHQMIDAVYPEFAHNSYSQTYLRERAILTPLNEDADKINEEMFGKIAGIARTFKSSDEVCTASTDISQQEQMFPIEFLNSLNFAGIPPHILKLKEHMPVMLLRNVNPTEGLCNGTRLLITRLGEWVVEAEIITGSHIGKKVVIPRITMTSPKTKWPFVMKRRQFPIKPCYAMTINKSQGQSLKYVGLYLPRPVFCHGQLYVALSRVTSPEGLKIMMLPTGNEPEDRTRNIVYKEIFTNLQPLEQVHL